MSKADFEWDESKNRENYRKHGVSFHDAQYAFTDKQRVIARNQAYSQDEQRYTCFGKNKQSTGILTVRFPYRNRKIRIIGAGYWRRGKRIYEQANSIQ